MMSTPVGVPLNLPLGKGLTVRTLRDADDIPRIAQLVSQVFEPAVGTFMHGLLTTYPGMTPADQFYVETDAGEMVSCLALVPWQWRYGPVTLDVGEMAVVGTQADYRGQGLVRAQVAPFKARLAARGCILSIIQGIPYFYRQFGYDYALPLEGGLRLEFHQLPTQSDPAYHIRRATVADIPALRARYDEAAASLTIHALRTPAIWEYLMKPYTVADVGSRQTWVVVDAAGALAGYVRLPEFHFGDELVVDEASRMTLEPALALLAHLRRRAQAAGQPFIRLNLPADSDLMRISRALGAHGGETYAWQLHIPNLAALLRTLAPALNARLADSVFAHWTRDVTLGLFHGHLRLRFINGALTQVDEIAQGGKSDFSLPPAALVPLIFGHRSLEEVRAAFPDVSVHGQWRLLVETLFPPTSAFIFPAY
jgi:predicted N-acetyltransferase YhbS